MKYFALLLEKEGHLSEQALLSSLQQSEILKKCYAYKSRVKTEEKLLEKVQIKLDEGKEYDLKKITDVVGLRLITLFRVDMVTIFEKIINIIKYTDALSPNPFKKDCIEEIYFYTNRSHDNIELQLHNSAVKLEVDDIYKLVPVEGEYSSIHIVTRLNKRIAKMSEPGDPYYVPVEIQIRTVFEDAWGEVDHKYGYSIKKGKKTDYKIHNPQNILRHLDTLKKFADACGEYADAIHLEIVHDNLEEIDIVNFVSVESDQLTIDLFRRTKVDEEDIGKYMHARQIKEMAIRLKSSKDGEPASNFLEAANVFRGLADKFLDHCGEVTNKFFYYYANMNHAFCLLSTNLKKEAEEALHIYEELEKNYPDFLLVKMRLAQAYGNNMLIDLALKKCEEAYGVYRKIIEVGFVPSEELPETDFNHISKHLEKIYGYYLWMKSEEIKACDPISASRKAVILRKAYLLTTKCLEKNNDSIDLNNNLLYYATELAHIVREFPTVKVSKEIIGSVEKHLEDLEGLIEIDKIEQVTTLDTIAKAYYFLERKEGLESMLCRIIALAEIELTKLGCDNEIIETIIREAAEMKAEVSG